MLSEHETTTPLASLDAPWGKRIELQQVAYENSEVVLFRIRIREGKRFTILDLDPATAKAWAACMGDWAKGRGEGLTPP